MKKITQEAWLSGYARRSGMTVPELQESMAARGRHPEPCNCGVEICEGWRWSWPDD